MRLSRVLVVAALVAACGGAPSPASAPAGSGAPSASAAAGGTASSGPVDGGGGASLADAAAKVKDWCALLPADLISTFAPGAPPVTAGTYPGECTASNGVAALDFRYTTGFYGSQPSGTESVPGLGQYAYLDRPAPDEVELWVALSADTDTGLFIDLAGHDGKDHKAEAVAIAQAILAKLQ